MAKQTRKPTKKTAGAAPGDLSFTLTPEILEKLRAQVTLPDQAALNQFMVDAINSYLHLGQLHAQGGDFLFQPKAQDDPVKLHFPFAPLPEAARG